MNASQAVEPPLKPIPSADSAGTLTEGVPVFLLVTVNGNVNPDLASMTQRGNHLFLTRETARQLGFNDDYLKTIPADTPLDGYPGLKVSYDEGQQSVAITAPFSSLNLKTENLGQGLGLRTQSSASPGMLLNYDLYATRTLNQGTAVSGATELRAFNNFGVASTNYLSQTQQTEGDPQWRRTTVRLDSTLEHSFQDKEVTVRLGDTLTQGLAWTRQTRIGGLQISRDFSLQPYQTTAPLPAYFGTAALPSSVQLYVNGIQQYSGQTQAGPFNLHFQPSVNGAGQAQVVMTDALGRSTIVNFPFYATSTLLREGLTDWSVETGYVRKDYGYQSFDYGQEPMGSGTVRYGLTRYLTLEGHAEGSTGISMGGIGATAALGTWGTLSGSWAASHTALATGSQFSLGYQLQRKSFSIGANTQQADTRFQDVASQYGSGSILRSNSAYASVNIGQAGTFGVNYVNLLQAGDTATCYGGLSWSHNLTRGATVSLAFNQNLNQPSDHTATLNLTISLDHGLSGYSSVSRSQNDLTSTLGASGSTQDSNLNWNVRGQRATPLGGSATAATTSGGGDVSHHARYADLNLGISASGNTTNIYGGATGALVATGDGVFASRRIDNSFAVVSTDHVGHVPVRYENRSVGRTNASGLLLVPTLLPYQNNKISIDPTELPLDMHIDHVQKTVVPRRGSGLTVTFGMQRIQAASIILKQPDGKPVPLGIPAYLNASTKPDAWVGYDGRLYLEGLKADNRLTVKDDNFHCTARFPFKDTPNALSEIGPLVCTP